MKKALLVITALFVFAITQNVYATSLSFSGESSAEQGVEYKLSLVYSGQDTLGSAEITFEYENAECTIYSPVAVSISSEKISVMSDDPIKSNTAIAILTCKSQQVGSSSIVVRSVDMTNGNGDVKLAEEGVPVIGERQMTITEQAGYVPPEPTPTPTPTDNPNPTPTPTDDPNPTPTDDPTRTQTPIDDTLRAELAIKSLEIIGYPITFSNDIDEYQIEVLEGVTDIYVVAETEAPGASFERLGKINIDGLDSVNVKLSNDSKSREVTIYIKRIPRNAVTPSNPTTTTKKSDGMDILKLASLGLNVILVAGGVYFYMQNKKTAKEGADENAGEETAEETKTEENTQNKEVKEEVKATTTVQQPQVAKPQVQETVQKQPVTVTTEAKPQQTTATPQVNAPQVIESITDGPVPTPQPVKKKKVVINTSSIIKD